MDWKIRPVKRLKGELIVPPDKSISHRAVMFGSISSGVTQIENFLRAEDCMSTLKAFRALGIEINASGEVITVKGKGLHGLSSPERELDLGNSGTSMRIIAGILAGQRFSTILTGDSSLKKRPMSRVMDPLIQMGASIESLGKEGRPPLKISGSDQDLIPIDYNTPVASAQVKSCVLAAGMYAEGVTSLTEPFASRDHTERMLAALSADIERNGLTTRIRGGKELQACRIEVPGDISSAAFFMVAGLLVPGSNVILRNVGLNPTRTGVVDVLKRMGGDIEVLDLRGDTEPVGDVKVRYSGLRGVCVAADEIPLLIDEVPILTVAASMAEGETRIKGISELKVKETDRVMSMITDLASFGAELREEGPDLVISGGVKKFKAASVKSFGDHRTAMSCAIAGLCSDGNSTIESVECVNTSYPGFLCDMAALSVEPVS